MKLSIKYRLNGALLFLFSLLDFVKSDIQEEKSDEILLDADNEFVHEFISNMKKTMLEHFNKEQLELFYWNQSSIGQSRSPSVSHSVQNKNEVEAHPIQIPNSLNSLSSHLLTKNGSSNSLLVQLQQQQQQQQQLQQQQQQFDPNVTHISQCFLPPFSSFIEQKDSCFNSNSFNPSVTINHNSNSSFEGLQGQQPDQYTWYTSPHSFKIQSINPSSLSEAEFSKYNSNSSSVKCNPLVFVNCSNVVNETLPKNNETTKNSVKNINQTFQPSQVQSSTDLMNNKSRTIKTQSGTEKNQFFTHSTKFVPTGQFEVSGPHPPNEHPRQNSTSRIVRFHPYSSTSCNSNFLSNLNSGLEKRNIEGYTGDITNQFNIYQHPYKPSAFDPYNNQHINYSPISLIESSQPNPNSCSVGLNVYDSVKNSNVNNKFHFKKTEIADHLIQNASQTFQQSQLQPATYKCSNSVLYKYLKHNSNPDPYRKRLELLYARAEKKAEITEEEYRNINLQSKGSAVACKMCKKFYNRRVVLTHHEILVHKISKQILRSDFESKTHCFICGTKFSRNMNLLVHLFGPKNVARSKKEVEEAYVNEQTDWLLLIEKNLSKCDE